MVASESTRERPWREIKERLPEREWLGAWANTDLIGQIPAGEWEAMHAGVCAICRHRARLYPCGWRCAEHKP